MKLARIIISLTICLTLFAVSVISVSAYYLYQYRWKSTSVHYYYDNWIGSRAISYLGKGATAWNNTNTPVTISFGSGNYVYCSVTQSSDSEWDGMVVTTHDSMYYVKTQSLTLNQNASRTWPNNGALKSVVVHEFGHVLGLADNGSTATIMNGFTWGVNGRYEGHMVTTPQSDDINGVNAIY